MRVISLVMGVAVAVSGQDKCCTSCTLPQEKYLSVDTKHNMCGECCMDPKDYNKFHLFEKNLEKANSTTPCHDLHFSNYSETVTHGAFKIKMTLDLYNPDREVETQAPATTTSYNCPDSAASIHASCRQTATFSTSCALVATEIQARVAGQYGGWHDPHNNGTYSILSASDTVLQLQRVTGDLKYTDKITIALSEAGGVCTLQGCSVSQVTSVADFSTNFCNARVLYCGSKDGCTPAKSDLESSLTDTNPSFGAGSTWKDCLKV